MMRGLVQESLSRVGIDPSAALARARSQSRGRKRTRSEAPADVEMVDAEQQKRLHSSKSRCCCLLAMETLFNQLCHNTVCLLLEDACDQDVNYTHATMQRLSVS